MIFFGYGYCSCHGECLVQLTISDDSQYNVLVHHIESIPFVGPREAYTIPAEALTRIKQIIDYYPRLFSMPSEIIEPWVCDGSRQSFFFSDGEREVGIGANNLWYALDDPQTKEDAEILLLAWVNIAAILIEFGVPARHMRLGTAVIKAIYENIAKRAGASEETPKS